MSEVWYILTGPKHWQDLHITHMQCQPFWLTGINAQGQKFQQEMKGALEPVQLMRFVIPKEGVPIVLKTLRADLEVSSDSFGIKMAAAALRKTIGLKDCKDIPLPVNGLPVSMDYIRTLVLGIKEDKEGMVPATGTTQELI